MLADRIAIGAGRAGTTPHHALRDLQQVGNVALRATVADPHAARVHLPDFDALSTRALCGFLQSLRGRLSSLATDREIRYLDHDCLPNYLIPNIRGGFRSSDR